MKYTNEASCKTVKNKNNCNFCKIINKGNLFKPHLHQSIIHSHTLARKRGMLIYVKKWRRKFDSNSKFLKHIYNLRIICPLAVTNSKRYNPKSGTKLQECLDFAFLTTWEPSKRHVPPFQGKVHPHQWTNSPSSPYLTKWFELQYCIGIERFVYSDQETVMWTAYHFLLVSLLQMVPWIGIGPHDASPPPSHLHILQEGKKLTDWWKPCSLVAAGEFRGTKISPSPQRSRFTLSTRNFAMFASCYSEAMNDNNDNNRPIANRRTRLLPNSGTHRNKTLPTRTNLLAVHVRVGFSGIFWISLERVGSKVCRAFDKDDK